jgi:hypothetical protein
MKVRRQYNVDEVAKVSGRSSKAIRRLRARGRGPRFRWVDGRLVVDENDLAAWLAGDTAATNTTTTTTTSTRHGDVLVDHGGAAGR